MTREILSPIPVFVKELGHLPELQSAFSVLDNPGEFRNGNESPESYIAKTYLEYIHLVQSLANLSAQDYSLVKEANRIRRERGVASG